MEKIPFNVSARAARLIGRENVAKAEGALIELIKNTYDADATICVVYINTNSDKITIIDNGEGMTDDVIKSKWMTIGTDHKQYDFKSKEGRVRTGAKGIGRFALDRLGATCEMLTKIQKDVGFIWTVDWSNFEVKGITIGDVKATLDSDKQMCLKSEVKKRLELFDLKHLWDEWGGNHGTIIEIKGLRDVWGDDVMENLFTSLELLIPPKEQSPFKVHLLYNEEIDKFGEVKATICDDYDYKLYAAVNEDKSVEVNIYRNELKFSELFEWNFFDSELTTVPQFRLEGFEQGKVTINTSVEKLLPGFKEVDDDDLINQIGAFDFSFYFMKRGGGSDERINSPYPYKPFNLRDRKIWLEKFGGIKLYRDNFRVRPYGEVGSNAFDWLGLGSRASSSPTVTRPGYKVRPNQVYGVLNISRIGNINFQDKSSREGLQENDIFSVFKQLVLGIIDVFEKDRNKVMTTLKKINDQRKKTESTKSEANKIIESIERGDIRDMSDEEQKTLVSAYKIQIAEGEDFKEEQKLLRVLATTGLIITSFTHELKSLSRRIGSRTKNLQKVLDELLDSEQLNLLPDYTNPLVMLSDMGAEDEKLKQWLDFSLASIQKNKRNRKKINLVDYIKRFEKMWQTFLDVRQIKFKVVKSGFDVVDVSFRGHEIDLDGIFNNLIANSIEALKRKGGAKERKINIQFDLLNDSVIYEDSGPGLSNDIENPKQIFEPFFTTKRNKKGEQVGTGLGMWIVKNILDEYDGKIVFLDVKTCFKIKIILPYQKH
ncbi:sensor histidine kinase [Microscilla marina]|uniref:histidine kinase n=1 Tax=Microscilla marina ATCC 23134 TaxID=313606 RepID=A1ZKH4_MICM2|nr:sensor histidine kinase [Microscilla marina]EAY29200.1 histidine Kinase, putative [Microscilla marina ATCC 23134]